MDKKRIHIIENLKKHNEWEKIFHLLQSFKDEEKTILYGSMK